MNPITLLPGDSLEVRSSDGSALEVAANPNHPDVVTLAAQGAVIPPEPLPSGACRIAVFQASSGLLAIRNSLTGGYADEVIPAPDPHGQPVVIGSEIWSLNDGVWTAPSGAKQQFGQAEDYGLGGQFGSSLGKAVCRTEDRYGSQGRLFKFGSGAYVPEYWIGSGRQELSFSHCWGEGSTPHFVGQAYPGGLWLIRAPHGSERRFEFDFKQGDWVVSARFDGTHAGLALVRAGVWSVWYNLDQWNPFHCDHQFSYGAPGDVPLAGNF
jgi:hypothetical protein